MPGLFGRHAVCAILLLQRYSFLEVLLSPLLRPPAFRFENLFGPFQQVIPGLLRRRLLRKPFLDQVNLFRF